MKEKDENYKQMLKEDVGILGIPTVCIIAGIALLTEGIINKNPGLISAGGIELVTGGVLAPGAIKQVKEDFWTK